MTLEYNLASYERYFAKKMNFDKSMNNKNLIILILLMVASSPIFSQETWSLDECVTYAVEHNLELNNFKYNSDTNKENYRQSIRNLLPIIEGFASYDIRYGRSIDPNNNDIINTDFFSNNYSLRSSVDLFHGFQKINMIKASKFLYKATQEDVLQQKYLLAFRVMSAFYDIRYYEGLVNISKEQTEASQLNYNSIKKQIELGLKAGADLYEAESVLLSDKLIVTQSENSLEAAQLKLIQEMNLKNVTTISITTSLEEITKTENNFIEIYQDSIYTTAKNFIPLIKSEELKVKAAKKEIAVARGDLYPSLSLFAGYGTGYFETFVNNEGTIIPFNKQLKDNASQYVGLSLNIPIFNRWSSRSNIKQQKIELQKANNNLNIQKQELYKLIQELVQTQKAMKKEVEQSLQKMKAQELTYVIAQKKYEKGMISGLELYQSKNLYANSQNENLQVRLRLKVNISTLDFYKGLPVFNSIRNN